METEKEVKTDRDTRVRARLITGIMGILILLLVVSKCQAQSKMVYNVSAIATVGISNPVKCFQKFEIDLDNRVITFCGKKQSLKRIYKSKIPSDRYMGKKEVEAIILETSHGKYEIVTTGKNAGVIRIRKDTELFFTSFEHV